MRKTGMLMIAGLLLAPAAQAAPACQEPAAVARAFYEATTGNGDLLEPPAALVSVAFGKRCVMSAPANSARASARSIPIRGWMRRTATSKRRCATAGKRRRPPPARLRCATRCGRRLT